MFSINKNTFFALGFLALIGIGGEKVGTAITTKQTRGIRNNNPGNIRWDSKTQWLGLIGGDDKNFIIFDEPKYGIRAMTRVLRSYQRRGIVTLGEIVSTWAPTNENNTEAYIKSVEQKMGLSRDQVIFEQNYPELIAAIIHHENGSQPYTFAQIHEGIAIA